LAEQEQDTILDAAGGRTHHREAEDAFALASGFPTRKEAVDRTSGGWACSGFRWHWTPLSISLGLRPETALSVCMITKIGLVTFFLPVFCGFVRGEPLAPERKVESNSVISARDPKIRIDLPASAHYLGADRWHLFGVADCEVHIFIQADEKKTVQSLFWIQFEGYLPEKPDQRYDYRKDLELLVDGMEFRFKARFGPTSEKPKAGSDLAHVLTLIAAGGYKLPPDMMNVRLVYLPDSSQRKELMVIYAEDLAGAGYSSTDLMAGEKVRPEWAGIEGALIERAKKQIRFHLQN
jgi:hypothetical protein